MGAAEADTSLLADGGEMGALMRAHGWERTVLGAPATWPESLRSTLGLCLNSAFPIAIYWGPELALLYNDAWRPILGDKHPWGLGRPAREVWPEIWETIEPVFRQVRASGKGVFHHDSLLAMNRYGYVEECYFDYTFNPIRAEQDVAGIFNVVIETTYRVLGERRARIQRDFAARLGPAKGVADVMRLAAASLADDPREVPFALLYGVDPAGRCARLEHAVGVAAGGPAAPERVALQSDDPWTLGRAWRSGVVEHVTDLAARFPERLPGGPWPEPAREALVLPISVTGERAPVAFLVAGVSPRRALDLEYREFFESLVAHMGRAIASAGAYESERQRAEALAELDRAKTAFFSNVSHEFRTPLTLMLGPVDDLLAAPPASVVSIDRPTLEVVHRNGQRLLKLVNVLLDFARIEAGRAQAVFEPTDLAALTAELASNFRSACERAGLALEVDCPATPVPAYVDHEMWEKIILNLLSNAFKFTLEGGIAVGVRAGSGQVVVTVRDTGVGIPEAELPRVFERFHRVHGVRGRTHEGTGIGLALVRELVRLHGGTVAAASEVGRGTTFTVTVPTGTAHLPADRIHAARTLPSAALGAGPYVEEALRWLPDDGGPGGDAPPIAGVGGRIHVSTAGARVLLADDNLDMRAYLRRLLEPYWAVEAVGDGAAALAAVRRERPDLVLADVMMPTLDGFGLLAALRADPATRTLPVVMLSARAGEDAHVEGLSAGADDYLVKPFSARELIARVNAHLELARTRREAEAAVREREHRFRQLVDLLPVAVYTIAAPAGVITFYNEQAARLWGRSPAVGDSDERFCGSFRLWWPDGTALPHDETPMAVAMQEGRSFRNEEVVLERPDGSTITVRVNIDPIRDAAGTVVGAINAFQDVTALTAAEHRLREEQRRKDEFLAMLAHELRNPLGPIQNAGRLLGRLGLDEPRLTHAADVIARQTAHLARLVDDLLDVSRITRGAILLQREPVRLDAVVGLGVELARPAIDRLEHELTVSHADPSVQVDGDAARLAQVVSNLLGNAAKFTPAGGRITLTTERVDGRVVLRVRDTGVGIDPAMRDAIFDLFVQQDTGLARTQGGLGIGLTLVRRIVELHGGTVGVRSEGVGHGSEFTVTLPVRPADAPAPRPAEDPRPANGARPVRVLLVEDNRDAAESLSLLLELGGHEVRVAHDGFGALVLVEDFAPDVGLIDVGLPGIDGYELAQRLRAHHACRRSVLVALTGYGRDEDKQRASQAGFDHHLTKPVDFEAIDRLLGAAASGAGGA